MKKTQKPITVQNENTAVGQDEANLQFIAQLEALVAELKAGRTIQTATLHVLMDIDTDRLPESLTAEERREIIASQKTAGQQIFTAIGPENDIVRSQADILRILGDQQAAKHREECHDPDCDLTDQQAVSIPFLKAFSSYLTKALVSGDVDQEFLLDQVRDISVKAKALSMMQGDEPGDIIRKIMQAMQEGGDDGDETKGGMVAIEGEQARAVMQALVGKNILPEALEATVKKDLAENGPAEVESPVELPANAVMVKGDHKVKH